MSLIAKMYIEDKEINILDFKFRFTRSTDEHGKPMGKPRGTVFEIIFETTSDQSFMQWSIATDMTKHVKIVVSPVTAASKSRIIELYDVHCVHFKNNFNAQNGEPMTTLIHLTPAIMIDDGYKVLDHYWKKTDLSANAPITVLNNEDEEGKIIDYYAIGEDGTRITEFKIGEHIMLVIESEGMEGKTIDIDLADKDHDFEYQGNRLPNDRLANYQITGEQNKIELVVLAPEN
ncbi:type VI secretion system tube protein TssD [Bernardetia sp. Wsw4-3y2]|uniref:type VI secretion system tube protein TssD n=1 Tax=Bernardetia sp. Wsw4-3y2 TaxID=3127471 RepID=UPI0030D387A2